jgi:hypothetical protein
MKYLFLILLFFALKVQAQSYVKVADKAEYDRYLAYCNTPIGRPFKLDLKVSALKINNLYVDSKVNWVTSKTPTISLVPYGTKTATTTTNQRLVSITIELPVQRRIPSAVDFNKYWLTGFIQSGLMDEKSGAY